LSPRLPKTNSRMLLRHRHGRVRSNKCAHPFYFLRHIFTVHTLCTTNHLYMLNILLGAELAV